MYMDNQLQHIELIGFTDLIKTIKTITKYSKILGIITQI